MKAAIVLPLVHFAGYGATPVPEAEGDERQIGFRHAFDDSLSPAQVDFIQNMLHMQHDNLGLRNLDDFVKMAFWAIVTAVVIEDDSTVQFPVSQSEIDSINVNGGDVSGITGAADVNLDAAMDWYHASYTEHGCYCWPEGATNITGFGHPLDELDRTCKQLYSCYRCLITRPECSHLRGKTINQDYHCIFSSNPTSQQIEITCDDSDICLRSLCECDKAFAMDAIHAVKNPANAGAFSRGECEKATLSPEKECCGDFPYIEMYPVEEKCCGADLQTYPIGSGMGGGECDDPSRGPPSLAEMYQTLTLR